MTVTGRRPGVALLYHDVVPRAQFDQSGIVTDGSWRYKLPPAQFEAHLDAVAEASYDVATVDDAGAEPAVFLTFDDGGVSCAERCQPLLEARGMVGHFFVITDRLGTDGYLSRQQVRRLADAGHHVGSHTVTHPNLQAVTPEERRRELERSKAELETLLGRPCRSVSIPGGFAGPDVVAAALDAGYDYVFTSDPRYVPSPPTPGRAVGRWTVRHDTSADELERILDREWPVRLRIQGRWYMLRTVKRVLGQERFERLRSPFVSRD